jgi:uncharacterized membrane protein YgcG
MAYDDLHESNLARSLTDVLADLSDLVQKEFRLAKAEVIDKVTTKVQAGIWMLAAGLLLLVVVLLVVEAAVFAIASFGIALHWACLIVAAVLAVAAGGLFFYARSAATETLAPMRTARQFTQDIRTAKEQLT